MTTATYSPEQQLVEGAERILFVDAAADADNRILDWILDQAERRSGAPATDDDDGWVETLIDDGRRSGITVQRTERPAFGDLWLDFATGNPSRGVRLCVPLDNQRAGISLEIASVVIGERIDQQWTLADLQQLHADLDRILSDPRFLGALAEQRQVEP